MQDIIPHWLTKQADTSPEQIAVEFPDESQITFRELKERSQQYARRLAGLGVDKNSHVGILSTNELSMIIAIHAISYLGAIAVLLNTRLTKEELNFQVKDAEVSVLLTNREMREKGTELNVPQVRAFPEVDEIR